MEIKMKRMEMEIVVHLGIGLRRKTSRLKRLRGNILFRGLLGSGLPRVSPRYHGRRTRGPDRASMWGPLRREELAVVEYWRKRN